MKKDLLILGGLVLDPASGLEAVRDMLIEGGKIKALLRPDKKRKDTARASSGIDVVDAAGCWVLPGVIDMHVHLREPGAEEAETVATGTLAAARGGVATVVAMPNTRPPIDTPDRVRWLLDKAASEALVNVLVSAAVTRSQRGLKLAPLKELAQAGACALSEDGRPVMDPELMRRALEFSAQSGLPVLDHAEDLGVTGCGVVHEGRFAAARRLPGIPSASEALMAMRDIRLAAGSGGRLHLCHVSAKETVELLRRAKDKGLPVTAEVTPHHLFLADTDIPDRDPNFKMKPPLRSAADRRALRQALADGTIDAIATDHAPHAPAAKAKGILSAPFGVIGLETLVPLSLELVRSGALSRRRWVEALSAAPARILGLKGKGHLRPGADADVTVLDPAARRVVSGKSASKSRNSPFIGRTLKGLARATVVGGRVVYRA